MEKHSQSIESKGLKNPVFARIAMLLLLSTTACGTKNTQSAVDSDLAGIPDTQDASTLVIEEPSSDEPDTEPETPKEEEDITKTQLYKQVEEAVRLKAQ